MQIRLCNIDQLDAHEALVEAWNYVNGNMKGRKPNRDLPVGHKFKIRHTTAGNVILKYRFNKIP